MTEDFIPRDAALRPAEAADIAEALTHALRFDGRRRVHDADELMAGLVATRLVAHLARCGFVLMKRAAVAPHDTSHHGHPHEADQTP